MNNENKKQNTDLLCRALSLISDEKECKIFLDDICTVKEIESLAQRLEVACMLDEGLTFNEIAAKTGASSATISRVNKCLNYGDGGYMSVIKKLKNN